jgi:hypothetical protein
MLMIVQRHAVELRKAFLVRDFSSEKLGKVERISRRKCKGASYYH